MITDKGKLALNIVQMLQEDPRRYRNFGVYWWGIKSFLKKEGYDQDQLPCLGNYEDPDMASYLTDLSEDEVLTLAVKEYAETAPFPRSGNTIEAPDGAIMFMLDQDVGV